MEWPIYRSEKIVQCSGKQFNFLNIVHPKFQIVDTIHLVAIADKRESKLSSYNLKYVCGPDGYDLREEKRTEIPGDKISWYFFNNKKEYDKYLMDDVIDCELLIDYHLPSIYYLMKYIPNISLQKLIFSGNAQKWNLMLKQRYPNSYHESDPIESYIGGMAGSKSRVL